MEKTWKGATKVDLEDRNRVSALPQVPIQSRKEGGRCYTASIQRLAGGGDKNSLVETTFETESTQCLLLPNPSHFTF